jgi:XTP/dITP diphosphohydrolase
MHKEIVLASNNAGKLKEFFRVLAPLGLNLQAQSVYHVADIEEPYFTFVENALAKARHTARLTGLPALADDSGICVAALGGAPGVRSARFAGEPKSDLQNNQHLIRALANQTNRAAYYYCVLVYVRSEFDPQPIIADAAWHGQIVDQARGSFGFGYDPHFFITELGKTAAELTPDEKNHHSHRGLALRELVEKLKKFEE